MTVTTKKSKKVKTVLNHLAQGIQDDGCYTSRDFYNWAKEFKHMVQEQIALIGGTDYQQSTGHYYISGFFKVGEQCYYISCDDVRYSNADHVANNILIRTATDYKDFHGGCNHYIKIEDNMFRDYENEFRGCLPTW